VLAIAHRTPRTAEGCGRLAALGVRVFEVDLQFLAGVPVVSHYLPLLAALPRLRHDRWRFTLRARAAAEEDLAVVVGRVPTGCAVLVDIKGSGEVAGLLRPGWYASGKDPEVLAPVIAAGHPTWLSVATRPALAAALAGDLPPGLDAVTVRHTYLDAAVVARLREHVPRVMAWTVQDPRRAAELAAAGVAGITSDSAAVHAVSAAR
jgi:hypothetical protein